MEKINRMNINGVTYEIEDVEARRSATPQMFGAKGDGVTDDTAAIQACLNASNNVYIPAGVYMINGTNSGSGVHTGGIHPKSNSTIIMAPDAVLKCMANDTGFYDVIRLASVENVTISGGKIIGDLDEHIGTDGQFGNGITIAVCNRIRIENIDISKCWGDGIGITSADDLTGENNDILIDKCIIHECRRQGISVIIGGKNNAITNCHIYGIGGVSPGAGIDIEANNIESYVTDVLIDGCTIHDTANSSIILSTGKNCRVSNCKLTSLNCYDYCENNYVDNCSMDFISIAGQDIRCSNSDIGYIVICGGSACFVGCKFMPKSECTAVIIVGNDGLNPTADYLKFIGCSFTCTGKETLGTHFQVLGGATKRIANTEFLDCDFYNMTNSVRLGDFTTRFANCRFHITAQMWTMFAFNNVVDTAKLVVEHCTLIHEVESPDVTCVTSIDGTGSPLLIFRNNHFASCGYFAYVSDANAAGRVIAHDNLFRETVTVNGNQNYTIIQHDNIQA